ncbi:MAG TPA: hypothetical protein VMB71_10400, partial [Acetobacteraceae bacterium]|nr:hypothetical protein [Acetobacteraceae bacterium]
RPGEAYVTANGVKILGYRNWPGRIGVAASSLYAKNLLTFLTTFWDKDAKAPKLPADDPIVQGVMVTRGGAVIHPVFAEIAASATSQAPTSQAPETPPPEPAPTPVREPEPPPPPAREPETPPPATAAAAEAAASADKPAPKRKAAAKPKAAGAPSEGEKPNA